MVIAEHLSEVLPELHNEEPKLIHEEKGRSMLSEIIQKLRKSRGMSQVELAKKLGVTKQAVSNWENNNILPSIDMLVRIAKFFSVSTDYLLELNQTHYIEVEGLSQDEIVHVQQLINDIRERNPVPKL